MDIQKCDRCGAVFETGGGRLVADFLLRWIYADRQSPDRWPHHADLCPTCARQLQTIVVGWWHHRHLSTTDPLEGISE